MSEFLEKALMFAADIYTDVRDRFRDEYEERVEERTNEEIEKRKEALERAHYEGITRTASALYEAKVDDEMIVSLLQRFWNIDENEAKETLRCEKTIWKPYRDIQSYLTFEGYDRKAVAAFIRENRVYRKLKNDPTLWKKTTAEILKAVQEPDK